VKQSTCTLLIKQIGGRSTRNEEKTQVLGACVVLWVYIFCWFIRVIKYASLRQEWKGIHSFLIIEEVIVMIDGEDCSPYFA
jgi:hypothetical protein